MLQYGSLKYITFWWFQACQIKKWSQVENPFFFYVRSVKVEHDICLNRFGLYNSLIICDMD